MSRALAPSDDALDAAAQAVMRGDLIGLPTETVYGLAANALDPAAVAKIYAAKSRPSFNPLIVHVARERATLEALAEDGIVDATRLSSAAREAIQALYPLWPGPLTLVLPKGARVPDLTTAGLDTVAVRVPDHPVAQALLDRLSTPLAAPSANRSGRISPTEASHVIEELGGAVHLVLDGGPCAVGLESTVVHIHADGAVTLLRPGAVTAEALAQHLGRPVAVADVSLSPHATPRSPGMALSHYAPQAPLIALPTRLPELPAASRAELEPRLRTASVVGVLCWTAADAAAAPRCLPQVEVRALGLTHDGDLHEAARRLFATLRALDAMNADLLLAEPCPPDDETAGIGFAIRDRLGRAGGR
jgi:L-threonylcarbamoyladenylate synthase